MVKKAYTKKNIVLPVILSSFGCPPGVNIRELRIRFGMLISQEMNFKGYFHTRRRRLLAQAHSYALLRTDGK